MIPKRTNDLKGKGCLPIQRYKENEEQSSVGDYKKSWPGGRAREIEKKRGGERKGESERKRGERDREREEKRGREIEREGERVVGRLVSRKELYLNYKEERRKEAMEDVRKGKNNNVEGQLTSHI